MLKRILGSWFIQFFCVLWAGFLFLDYINSSHYFIDGFLKFDYTNLVVVSLIITGFLVYLFSNKRQLGFNIEILNFRGIYHYGLVLLYMVLIMLFYLMKTELIPNIGSGVFVFLVKSIVYHLGFVFIVIAAFGAGSYFISLFPFKPDENGYVLVSIAIGFVLVTLLLFLLGLVGILYSYIVIALFVAIIGFRWKAIFSTFKVMLFEKSKPTNLNVLSILAYSIVAFLVALNLAYLSRPYPIGFDDLNLYMNIPKLIGGYNSLTNGGDAYNWSIMMSLGFVMFNSTTLALLISVLPGVLSMFVLSKICKQLNIGANWTLLVCLLYYTFPNTLWQSRNDAKVDLALLFIALCSLLVILTPLVKNIPAKLNFLSRKLKNVDSEYIVWVFCGILMGYAFGIKYVVMLNVFAFLVYIFYKNSGKFGAATMFFMNFAIILQADLTKFAAFDKELVVFRVIIPAVIALLFLLIALYKDRQGVLRSIKYSFIFLLFLGLTFSPWIIKNVSENHSISMSAILTGKQKIAPLLPEGAAYSQIDSHSGKVKIEPIHKEGRIVNYSAFDGMFSGFSKYFLKSDESSNQGLGNRDATENIKSSKNTDKQEEIRRYLGYEDGIIRFISLPYDIVMKSNVKIWSADTGIILLIILPVLMFSFTFKELPVNLLKIFLLFLFISFSILSVLVFRGAKDFNEVLSSIMSSSMNKDTIIYSLLNNVYYPLKSQIIFIAYNLKAIYLKLTIQRVGVCFMYIPIFSIPIYFLYKVKFKNISFAGKTIIAFSYAILNYWLLLSSGIIWYGITGFALLPVVIALLVTNSPVDSYNENRFFTRYVVVCTMIWVLLIFPFQFMPVKYMNQPEIPQTEVQRFMEPVFVKFAIGAESERDVFKQFFNPTEQNILNTINADPSSKIVNIATFLTYHIKNNDIRVYNDNQLGVLGSFYDASNGDKNLLVQKLKNKEVRYVLVGLNATDIDVTPGRTLSKKFNNLMNALVNNPNVRLRFTNRIVERPDGDMNLNIKGRQVKAKYELAGITVVDRGSIALFEIL